jgi:hypothetical protein
VLFNSKLFGRRGRLFYRVNLFEDGTILLQAGLAEGITESARFDILAGKDTSDKPICSLEVQEVGPVDSTFKEPESQVYGLLYEQSGELWALMTHVGVSSDVAIYIPPGQDFLPIHEEISNKIRPEYKRTITVAKEGDSHELAIFKDANGTTGYEITDLTCIQMGLARLPYSTPLTASAVYPVLSAAADFFFHLRRSNKERLLANDITVSVYKVKPGYIHGSLVLEQHGEDLNNESTVQIKIKQYVKERYGITVRSKHEVPLYVWAFMFNMSDFSICVSATGRFINITYAVI